MGQKLGRNCLNICDTIINCSKEYFDIILVQIDNQLIKNQLNCFAEKNKLNYQSNIQIDSKIYNEILEKILENMEIINLNLIGTINKAGKLRNWDFNQLSKSIVHI